MKNLRMFIRIPKKNKDKTGILKKFHYVTDLTLYESGKIIELLEKLRYDQ